LRVNAARLAASASTSLLQALRQLADQVLEAPDLGALTRLLTRSLPEALSLEWASLLLWNRKLDSFEAVSGAQPGVEPPAEATSRQAPQTRYLISDGALLETPGGSGHGVLLPLQARSGLLGMLVLPGRRGRRKLPFRAAEARLLSVLANRAAMAIENHLFQRELISSERMAALGTMAGMLAHDFRGPMTVIRGYAEILQHGVPDSAQIREHAGLIVEMVDRLERMTAETLDFAREGDRLVRRPHPLRGLLEDLAAGVEREHPGLRIVRAFTLPEQGTAEVDVDKLRRVLGNLAANARDAMGGSGRLHLSADVLAGDHTPGSAQLRMEVADEGPGVPVEIRDRLFDPFVTLGKKGGTGLGLAVARRFVEDHSGTLELVDQGPGARFRILLPLKGPPSGVIQSSQEGDPS
jgi:signal transduction histidine kinase